MEGGGIRSEDESGRGGLPGDLVAGLKDAIHELVRNQSVLIVRDDLANQQGAV